MKRAPLTRLLYVSRASESVDAAVVDAIVAFSRDFNPEHGVTGLLLYSGTHFAQVLEGPEAALASLMASIRRDGRHDGVRTLLEEPVERRECEGWAMAYVHELGMSDLLTAVWGAPEVDMARAQRLVAHLFHRFGLTPRA